MKRERVDAFCQGIILLGTNGNIGGSGLKCFISSKSKDFTIPVIYPCLAICTYITGAKTGECLSGKTLERFVIALIAAVLITFLIRPYHSIISNLHAYGRTSFISWGFFNKTNGILLFYWLCFGLGKKLVLGE